MEILDIYKTIAKPHCFPYRELAHSPKAKAIAALLKKFGYKNIVLSKRYGVRVGNPFKAKKIIMSHMDLISEFNKEFRVGPYLRQENNLVFAHMDNTMTNAVLLYLMQEKALFKSVFVLFTIGEEPSSEPSGAHNLFRHLEEFIPYDTEIINLDVIANQYHGLYNHILIEKTGEYETVFRPDYSSWGKRSYQDRFFEDDDFLSPGAHSSYINQDSRLEETDELDILNDDTLEEDQFSESDILDEYEYLDEPGEFTEQEGTQEEDEFLLELDEQIEDELLREKESSWGNYFERYNKRKKHKRNLPALKPVKVERVRYNYTAMAKHFIADPCCAVFEYVNTPNEWLSRYMELLEGEVHFKDSKYGTADDLGSVPDGYGKQFSFCLLIENPIDGAIHSTKTFSTIEKIDNYASCLKRIILE